MDDRGRSLDIILPCFNPRQQWADNIIESVRAIREGLPGVKLSLILVNDGSTKGFDKADAARIGSQLPDMGFLFIDKAENKGKGHALREGVKAAKSNTQVYTDVDFPYTGESLLRLARVLLSGEADVAAGVRDKTYYKGVPARRKLISKFVRWLLRTFLRLEITDTQCGLKGFNEKGREIFLQTRIDRFLFDMEFIFLASNDPGIRLQPVEVELKPHIVFSKMNWGILLQEGWNFIGVFLMFLRKKF